MRSTTLRHTAWPRFPWTRPEPIKHHASAPDENPHHTRRWGMPSQRSRRLRVTISSHRRQAELSPHMTRSPENPGRFTSCQCELPVGVDFGHG